MAKVLSLGGEFIKTPDPAAWRAWYRDALGVEFQDFGGAVFEHPAAGSTDLTSFDAGSDYFAPSSHPFMINLIVDDMDGVLARAATAGADRWGARTMTTTAASLG